MRPIVIFSILFFSVKAFAQPAPDYSKYSYYLKNEKALKEIGLSELQKIKLENHMRSMIKDYFPAKGDRFPTLTYEQALKKVNELTEKFLKEHLTEAQRLRLIQIELQSIGHVNALRQSWVVEKLELTTAQAKDYIEILRKLVKEESRYQRIVRDPNVPETQWRQEQERLQKVRKQLDEVAYKELLTLEQQRKLDGIYGKPFSP